MFKYILNLEAKIVIGQILILICSVISKEHMDKIENYISVGVKEGGKLIEDGRNYKIKVKRKVILSDQLY